MSKWINKQRTVRWIADHPESTANLLSDLLTDLALAAVDSAMFPQPTAADAAAAIAKAREILIREGGLAEDSDEVAALDKTSITVAER